MKPISDVHRVKPAVGSRLVLTSASFDAPSPEPSAARPLRSAVTTSENGTSIQEPIRTTAEIAAPESTAIWRTSLQITAPTPPINV
ncbi:MAG: hypothetical protein R3F34_00570 [Planctomycetota bacterium]